MKSLYRKPARNGRGSGKNLRDTKKPTSKTLIGFMELMTRFELVTSSLPIAIIAHGVLKLCLSWFEDLSLGRLIFVEIQARKHPVQPFAPEAVEPFAFPEAFHQMRADCVIAADERASEPMLFRISSRNRRSVSTSGAS